MHCQQCGAPMRVDRDRGLFVCDYCGGEFAPPPEADGVLVVGETKLPCPTCTAPLADGLLQSFSLKYCAPCRGMLIAMQDLLLLIDALRVNENLPSGYFTERSSADADRHLKCPQCGSPMDGHPYGGGGNINVDTCETCSLLWLDRGELHKIVMAPDREPIYLDYERGDHTDRE